MIELQLDDLIGPSSTRCCYHHPLDPGKRIKIAPCKKGFPVAKEVAFYRKLATSPRSFAKSKGGMSR